MLSTGKHLKLKFIRMAKSIGPIADTRRGKCNGCADCCKMPIRCPFLDKNNRCVIYTIRPPNCRKYPRCSEEFIKNPKCGYKFK